MKQEAIDNTNAKINAKQGNKMRPDSDLLRSIPGIMILVIIILTNFYDYLLFHTLAELFSIVIAFCIFLVSWNSRHFHRDGFFLFLGVAYSFVGFLEALHTMSYEGMVILYHAGLNLATQMWIIARYIESISLLVAFFLAGRRVRVRYTWTAYTLVIGTVLLSVLYFDFFPACYVKGIGLTPFKKISEYVISIILLAAAILLMKKRTLFDKGILKLLALSIFFSIGAELIFTVYIDVFQISNMLGHLFKIFSFFFIYKAMVETTLKRPYKLLFRKLMRHEEELKKAKEDAELSNQAKSDFLAKMSHDLRTPLNGILGFSQLLQQDSNITPDQKESLETIEQCGHHLLSIINDILDLSKIEAGKIELEISEFYLPSFLRSTCNIVRVRAETKGISFYFQPYDFKKNVVIEWDLPHFVSGDERRLRQVLVNLLGNAVKFTENGKVVFKAGRIDNERSLVRFQVEDTGVGISPEQISAIFEPFQQVGNSEHRSEGTGLGLTISRQLVRILGGELQVESTLGKGSLFRFDIPLTEVEMEGEPVPVDLGWITCEEKTGDDLPLSPALEEVAALYHLVLVGDVNEIRERLETLEKKDAKFKPFVTEIRRFIKGYQMHKITKFLESYLEPQNTGE